MWPWYLTHAPYWSMVWPLAWRPQTSCSTWVQRRSAGEWRGGWVGVSILTCSITTNILNLTLIFSDLSKIKNGLYCVYWTFPKKLYLNLTSFTTISVLETVGNLFYNSGACAFYHYQPLYRQWYCWISVPPDRTDSHVSWSTCWPREGEKKVSIWFTIDFLFSSCIMLLYVFLILGWYEHVVPRKCVEIAER